MNTITFSTKTGYKSYIKLAFQRSYQSRLIMAVHFGCLLLILSASSAHDMSNSEQKLLILLAIVIMLSYPIRIYFFARNRFKSTPNITGEKFWMIDENGIDIKSNSYFVHLGWDAITRFNENKQYFFIYFSNTEYTYFPKNAVTEFEFFEIKKLFFLNRKKGY